jgi:hypothetical protein
MVFVIVVATMQEGRALGGLRHGVSAEDYRGKAKKELTHQIEVDRVIDQVILSRLESRRCREIHSVIFAYLFDLVVCTCSPILFNTNPSQSRVQGLL